MADIHVLMGNLAANPAWTIVIHFPMPAGNNLASTPVSWKNAYLNSRDTPASVMTAGDGNNGTISASELADIVAGDVIEHQFPFIVESGGTTAAQLLATLQGQFSKQKAARLATLQHELRYFGQTASES